jgi:hypothetical protein
MALSKKPRKRAARVDSSIAKLKREIEARYKLPTGCIKIVRPNGRQMRSTSTVGLLLEAWR